MEREANGATTPRLSFRPDIEGLRAVAVVLVVLLHAGVTRVSGGYVGVDVFFVISGFLITSLLMNEFGSTRRISILGFYARRARRILPAACLVIVVTVIAVYAQLGTLIGRSTATDGVWSSVFMANFRFIATGTDYFASALPPSALQHYWSLAVEEQFYFVWPTLFFGLMLLGRRLGRSALTLRLGLVAVVGCSLLWSIHQSATSPTAAYFSPLTRAWELGAGALTAAFSLHISKTHSIVRVAATWIGLGLVMIAAFTFTSTTVFPGYAAMLPVGGTALVIAGGIGSPTGTAELLLGLKPVRWLGRISFSLYLWHWPVLVIAEQRSTQPLDNEARVACVVVALILSVASYYLVERPMHVSSFLKSMSAGSDWLRARKALLAGFVAIAVAVSVSVATAHRATSSINAAVNRRVSDISPATGGLRLTNAQAVALQHTLQTKVQEGLALHTVPRILDPPVLALKTGFDRTYTRCMQEQTEQVAARTCAFGSVKSHDTIVVLGDSHAMTWMPALDAYGKAAGYKIVTLYKARCPLPDATRPCVEWRTNALEYIASHPPVAVIISFTQSHTSAGPREIDSWVARYRTTLETLRRSGAALIQIANNPVLPEDPGLCLSRPDADPSACTGEYASRARVDAERAVVDQMGGITIDPQPWLCFDTKCPVIIGGYIAYADTAHISAQYVRYLAPFLGARLREAGLR